MDFVYINLYKLYRDGIFAGVFTSKKSMNKYIGKWEESYYNQDPEDFNPNYVPNWTSEQFIETCDKKGNKYGKKDRLRSFDDSDDLWHDYC